MLLTVSTPFQRNLTAYPTVRETISAAVSASSALSQFSIVVKVATPTQQQLCGVGISQNLVNRPQLKEKSILNAPITATPIFFSTQEAVVGK